MTCCQGVRPPPIASQPNPSLRTRCSLGTYDVRARRRLRGGLGYPFAIVAPSSRAQVYAARAGRGRRFMMRWTLTAALGGVLCGLIVAPALAQNAAPAASVPTKLRPATSKPKTPEPKTPEPKTPEPKTSE